jgi:hypothetical protein
MKTTFSSVKNAASIILIAFAALSFSSCEKENLDELKIKKTSVAVSADSFNKFKDDPDTLIRNPEPDGLVIDNIPARWDGLAER